MGFGEHFDFTSPARRSSTRSGGSPTRRPATTCAAPATSGCGETPLQWPVPARRRRRPPPDPLPQRRCQPGPVRRRRRAPAAAGVSRRRRGARCSTPARTWMPRELPDDDYPLVLNTGRLQHQWHTMTKTGKVAKLNKLDSGPFVEIHPADAVALGIADGRPGRARRRGAAGPCCPPSSPTGCGRATASCRFTGTTNTAST